MTRSRLILLDANVVIQILSLGIWKQVVERCDLIIAQTVIDEVQFFETPSGREYVDWPELLAIGTVRVESLPAAEVTKYCDQFGYGYYEKLDPGEAESLALLGKDAESRICSADKIVWRVLGNTNAVERGISLEEVSGALLEASGALSLTTGPSSESPSRSARMATP